MAKRDLDRIRLILLHLESGDSPDGWVWTRNDAFYRASDDYQFTLMEQAGFITGLNHRTLASVVPDRVSITYQGHDYLDAVRSEKVWAEVTKKLLPLGGSAAMEVVKDLAVEASKRFLGI